MAELTQVVGAILRDLARSRVISDTYSRDVSLAYEQDPILSSFPVPRAEIREAVIDFGFAVQEVRQQEVDQAGIVQQVAARVAPRMANTVYAIAVLENEMRDELQALLKEKGIEMEALLTERIDETIGSSRQQVAAALAGQPTALIRRVQTSALNTLQEQDDIKELLLKGISSRALRGKVGAITQETVDAFVLAVLRALGSTTDQALVVDVAVTRGELIDVPAAILSHVNIVAEIRNYEWVDVGEEDGEPIRRLRPE